MYYDPLPEAFKEQKPTKILWALFRQGGTLCYILNLLMKNAISYIEPLNFQQQSPDFDSKSCKMNVFNFLQACQEDFFIPVDQLFSVSEIYKDDSTVLLRTIKLVEELLSRIEGATWLAPHDTPTITQLGSPLDAKARRFSITENEPTTPVPITSPEPPSGTSSTTNGNNLQSDLRKKAIKELLETERIYVSQLDVLQVCVLFAHSFFVRNIFKRLNVIAKSR